MTAGRIAKLALISLMLCLVAAMIGCSAASRGLYMPAGEAVMDSTATTQGTAATPPAARGPGVSVPVEELWVISKPPRDRAAPHSDFPLPGEGRLIARRDEPGGTRLIPVPLRHTAVRASVVGYIATVDVQQKYHNPYDQRIDAAYVFPLPQNAAVNEFIMTIGPRHIRGIIRERKQAEQIYREAKGQGYVASLFTQQLPNVFTQLVANIEPGREIDVDIRYFNTLEYRDGAYEFAFPMVVGPRFNPPGDEDDIGAVPRGASRMSRKKSQMHYLRPDERSGHDIALTLNIDASVSIEKVESRNHKVSVRQLSPRKVEVTLDAADSVPNRDFVVRYQVAGTAAKPALIVQRDGDGSTGGSGYFTLMLFPPATQGNAIMGRYSERAGHPALCDIQIDWTSAKVHDVFPRQVPDLYVGRPVILIGRFDGELPASITLRAKLGGRNWQIEVPIQHADADVAGAKPLAAVWARSKIADLSNRAAHEGGVDLPSQVRQIAMEYNLLSDYTAFVSIDSLTRTPGDHGVTIAVPVPVPKAVRSDTTVQEAGNLSPHDTPRPQAGDPVVQR